LSKSVLKQSTFKHRHPEINRAHEIIRSEIKRGNLTRPRICSYCGKTVKTQAHHLDYKYPLMVVWLCHDCHVNFDKIRREYEAQVKAN